MAEQLIEQLEQCIRDFREAQRFSGVVVGGEFCFQADCQFTSVVHGSSSFLAKFILQVKNHYGFHPILFTDYRVARNFCGLSIFCFLREQIFAFRTDWFFLPGIIFLLFSLKVPSTTVSVPLCF